MKKSLQEKFKNRKIKKPNKFLASIIVKIFCKISKKQNVSFVYEDSYNELSKKQVIYLCQHKSANDYLYVFAGIKRTDIHVLCGLQNVFQKYFYTILKHLGVIGKYLYQPDVGATKQILQSLKLNDSIVIFPEGIQSTSGSTHPINPATIKLLCKLKLPVVLVKIKGSYFTKPRYTKDLKTGKITVTYSKLFDTQDFNKFTKEEIYNKLLEQFKYNEFEEFSNEKVEFIGKKPNIDGLDNIIYKCPNCNDEANFSIENDKMTCKGCGFKIKMDNYYDIFPVENNLPFKNIDEWFKWQRKEIRNEVKNDNFNLNAKVKLATINPKKITNNYSLLYIGEGVITLTNKGLKYLGTRNGENVELFFDAKSLFSLSISLNYEFDFYYTNEYFNFKLLDNEKLMTKWMLATEEIHNLYDSEWEKASCEVY
jgi:1-acyl-sn-glycerol-3-phosphate acyltransferase